jgi:uncharacterized membrane protein
MKVYNLDELEDIVLHVVPKAQFIWRVECDKELKAKGDWGSCVLGAGFYVNVKDGRKIKQFTIMYPHQVTNAQGSCVWEAGLSVVKEYFDNRNIEVGYKYGQLD